MSLEDRIRRLEERVLRLPQFLSRMDDMTFLISGLLLAGAAFSAERGLGLPNHPYQIALAVLAMLLGYHRRWFLLPQRFYHWLMLPLNIFVLSMCFKLVVGGGKRNPLFWLRYPDLTSTKPEGNWLPQISVLWQPTQLATWELDFTVIQTFLLIVTLIGVLFDIDVFVSLMLFVLIVISVPIFANFEWTWVFPALLLATLSWYFQSQGAKFTSSATSPSTPTTTGK